MIQTLVLHPPIDLPIPIERLRACCHELGLCGDALAEAGPNCFAAGERYLDLVTFVGCSPNIHLNPDEASLTELSYIHFPEPLEQPSLRFGQAVQAPKCPNCKAKFSGWQSDLDEWSKHPLESVLCKQCGHSSPIQSLRWGYTAAVVSTQLHLRGIYPFEGIPTEQLIDSLERKFDCRWQYFYC